MKDITTFIKIVLSESKKDSERYKSTREFIDNDSSNKNLTDDDIDDLNNYLKNYIYNNAKYSKVITYLDFAGNDDLSRDIAGYIIEAAIYRAVKRYYKKEYDKHNQYKLTSRSGRGLKINGKSIYWDFSVIGIDEKFEIKSICKNSYHLGPISPTDKQKNDTNLIYIGVPYDASETGFTIDKDKIVVSRNYKDIKK